MSNIFINVIVTLCSIANAEDCQTVFDIRPVDSFITERQCLDRAAVRAEAWAAKNRPGFYVTTAVCVITEARGA